MAVGLQVAAGGRSHG